MNTCAVTIAGPDNRVDLVVSTETPVAELIPTFVELSVDDPPPADGAQPVWTVAPSGKQPLPLDRTLGEAGITDGAVLTLIEVRSQAQAPPAPARVHRPREQRGSPRELSDAALPEHLFPTERMMQATKAFFGYEAQAPLLESAEPAKPSKRDMLTKPEERSALERARRSWRETDYISRLERSIAEPRLSRCVTLAVISPKGGVGKTTVTALVGSLLARTRRDRAVAVDTNPDYGSLGRNLAPDHRVYVDDLQDILDRPDLSATELDAQLGRGSDGLMVLPAPTDPERMAALDEAAYTKVIERMQSLVGILVLDCGTGLQEPAARAAQACADQILLVSDAHPATASLVAEAGELLRTSEPPLTLVVNRMPKSSRGARIEIGGLEQLVPEARGLTTIEDEPHAAAQVARGEFSWDDAPRSWNRSVRELAALLATDWRELAIAR